MRQHAHSGVHTDGRDLFTASLREGAPGPGRRVVGTDGREYRSFPPTGSKMAALVKAGAETWPFQADSQVLYLGAGAGTTASFMSDICPEGKIFAVEFSPEPFRRLVEIARGRVNIVPVLADARSPGTYSALVGGLVDIVYQDVAQRDQWEIAHRNALAFLGPGGWVVLMVKSQSVDVARPAQQVYAEIGRAIEETEFHVQEFLDIGDYEAEHGVFISRRTG